MANDFSVPTIALTDLDWRWATWRDLPPMVLAANTKAALPFDPAACIERFATLVVLVDVNGRKRWDFSKAGITHDAMSKEEARFWFDRMLEKPLSSPKKRGEELLRDLDPPRAKSKSKAAASKTKKTTATKGTLGINGVRAKMDAYVEPPLEFALVLARLFSPMEVTEWFLEEKPAAEGSERAGGNFFYGYREHVFPRLTLKERGALRKRLAPDIVSEAFANDVREVTPPGKFVGDHFVEPDSSFFLAVLLGMHSELDALVRAVPDSWYRGSEAPDGLNVPQLMIFGLGSSARVEEEITRLGLTLHHPAYARAWLAHTETRALGRILEAVLKAKAPKEQSRALELAKVLALVHAPEATGPMLMMDQNAKPEVARIATEWLKNNVPHAIRGYMQIASTDSAYGALAAVATARLRKLKEEGHGALIGASDAGESEHVTLAHVDRDLPVLTDKTLPSSLAKALRVVVVDDKVAKLIKWVDVAALPDIEIKEGTCRLSQAHLTSILAFLARATLEDAPSPLILAMREHATERSRDAFAWAVFEQWVSHGADSKQKWAFAQLAFVGGETSAMKLALAIQEWPGRGLHVRAVLALEILNAMQSDAALVQVSGLALRLHFPKLKERAEEMMRAVAKKRGVSRHDIHDIIVPSGGFDDGGRRSFVYGTQKFDVVLGADAAPALRDVKTGVRSRELPPLDRDLDVVEASRVANEWKMLATTLTETFRVEAYRLEHAMIARKKWTINAFMNMVKHPLMRHLAQTLVWALRTTKKKETYALFRVAEDGSFSDVKDNAFVLPPSTKEAGVCIAHPIDMTDGELAAWGSLFVEYEILPPFEQLNRKVYRLSDAELTGTEIARFQSTKTTAHDLLRMICERGYTHGDANLGALRDHHKEIPGAEVFARIQHDSFFLKQPDNTNVTIVHAYFTDAKAPFYSGFGTSLALNGIDPLAISELLYDLWSLEAE